MSGVSTRTIPVTIRLPVGVYTVLTRRARGKAQGLRAYLQRRVVYDTLRKHTRSLNGQDG